MPFGEVFKSKLAHELGGYEGGQPLDAGSVLFSRIKEALEHDPGGLGSGVFPSALGSALFQLPRKPIHTMTGFKHVLRGELENPASYASLDQFNPGWHPTFSAWLNPDNKLMIHTPHPHMHGALADTLFKINKIPPKSWYYNTVDQEMAHVRRLLAPVNANITHTSVTPRQLPSGQLFRDTDARVYDEAFKILELMEKYGLLFPGENVKLPGSTFIYKK